MSDEATVNERIDQLLAEHTAADTPEFLGAMYDLGLANVSLPEGFGGLGVSILSTSRGVMSGNQARRQRVGGEVLCHVW